jgi:hypothetical protein
VQGLVLALLPEQPQVQGLVLALLPEQPRALPLAP